MGTSFTTLLATDTSECVCDFPSQIDQSGAVHVQVFEDGMKIEESNACAQCYSGTLASRQSIDYKNISDIKRYKSSLDSVSPSGISLYIDNESCDVIDLCPVTDTHFKIICNLWNKANGNFKSRLKSEQSMRMNEQYWKLASDVHHSGGTLDEHKGNHDDRDSNDSTFSVIWEFEHNSHNENETMSKIIESLNIGDSYEFSNKDNELCKIYKVTKDIATCLNVNTDKTLTITRHQ
eukprot:71532_1